VLRIRQRPRRLSSASSDITRFRRSRFSTASSYYSVHEDNTALMLSRISPSDPNHHEDAFMQPFRPWKIDCVADLPKLNRQEVEKYAFNQDDTSPHIFIKEDDKLTMHRLPVAQSTDAIRGKVGFTHGMHVWKVLWPVNQRGTHAMIGVATKEHLLHSSGYVSLIGSEEGGYGWDLGKLSLYQVINFFSVKNFCFHSSRTKDPWLYPDPNEFKGFKAPREIYCILDMDDGYLAFSTEEQFLGVAFYGLKGKTLYPVISAVWGHCEVSMEFVGSMCKSSSKSN
jgi:SPRY domain-containing SOCS box protein 1/4